MDRQRQVAELVDHYRRPRFGGVIEDADVAMPGGSPECGGSVVVYLKGTQEEEGRISALSFTGEGDIISQAATSMALEQVIEEGLTMDEVLDLDYEAFVDRVGREAVGNRTRNATMGLSTLKAAVRKYRKDRLLPEPARNGAAKSTSAS